MLLVIYHRLAYRQIAKIDIDSLKIITTVEL